MKTAADVPQSPEFSYIMLRNALARFSKAPAALTPEERQEILSQAAREFRLQTAVLSSIEAGDVVVPDTGVANAVAEIAGRYPDRDAFLDDLETNGMDLSSLETALHRDLKVNAVLDKVAANAADVNDLDIKIYYYMHGARFVKPETRVARHILITINEDYPENTRQRARARLEAVADRLDKKRHRFAEQALKHSECPTAMHGGLMGRVTPGKLYPELERVLYDLAPGELSPITESPLGFHLLLCEEIEPEQRISLEQATPSIRKLLEERRRRMCQKAWLAKQSLNNKG